MNKPTGIVNIRGKEYQTVAFRVQTFRDRHPDWTLQTEIVVRDADVVVMRSVILDQTGRMIATGHAEEKRKASQINATSALENAETSAIGRALAALGLGGTEFASANEVQNAIHQQEKSGVHKPTDGAMDLLPADRQKVIQNAAADIRSLMDEGRDFDAFALCEDFGVPEEKVALWSLLDSKQRRRIKEQSEISKQKEAA